MPWPDSIARRYIVWPMSFDIWWDKSECDKLCWSKTKKFSHYFWPNIDKLSTH